MASPPVKQCSLFSFCFFKRAFHREEKNIPKVPLAPRGHSRMPISVTLAGGSWLSLALPGWRAAHVPPMSLPASRAGPWGTQTSPHSPRHSVAPTGHREERGCFPSCLRYQRFTGGWRLPSIAPHDAPALQVHPHPGSHGMAACCIPAPSPVRERGSSRLYCGKPSELVRTLLGLSRWQK